MHDYNYHLQQVQKNGFTILGNIFSFQEIEKLLLAIERADSSKPTFRKSSDLFAIRRFLSEIPEAIHLVFNERLNHVIKEIFGNDYFVVKSIYFDKPESSNWFVPYHQDLTISVDKKSDAEGFGPWSVKEDRFAVQPPLSILQNIFTIRIHIDNTDENNGALRVIPGSHLKGVCRPETIDWTKEKETICTVPEGGIMIMRPLLLHASGRTINNRKRRVIHIEFSSKQLPPSLKWSEKINPFARA